MGGKVAAGPSEPLVSVVVPVYNTETVLKACLDSLVNQTLADIEIIVVNDASTDGSMKIVESYAAADSRFRVLENSGNRNLFETRRRGFAAARGEYMATCDSDDYMPGAALERLYETARKAEADIVHGCIDLLIDGRLVDGRRLGWHYGSPFNVSSGRSFVESFLGFGRGWSACGKLYHRTVVKNALAELPVNRRLFLGEDLLFSFFFGLQAGRYAGCPKIVYHHRFSGNNYYSQPEKWPRNVADFFDVLSIMKSRLERKDLPVEYNILLEEMIKKTVIKVFRNLPSGADSALARGLIVERLGKSYLMNIYGEDFSRSPLGDDYGNAGNKVRSAGFVRKALIPGYLIFFALVQLRKNGFYEFAVRCRQLLSLFRRNGCRYLLEKLLKELW